MVGFRLVRGGARPELLDRLRVFTEGRQAFLEGFTDALVVRYALDVEGGPWSSERGVELDVGRLRLQLGRDRRLEGFTRCEVGGWRTVTEPLRRRLTWMPTASVRGGDWPSTGSLFRGSGPTGGVSTRHLASLVEALGGRPSTVIWPSCPMRVETWGASAVVLPIGNKVADWARI